MAFSNRKTISVTTKNTTPGAFIKPSGHALVGKNLIIKLKNNQNKVLNFKHS